MAIGVALGQNAAPIMWRSYRADLFVRRKQDDLSDRNELGYGNASRLESAKFAFRGNLGDDNDVAHAVRFNSPLKDEYRLSFAVRPATVSASTCRRASPSDTRTKLRIPKYSGLWMMLPRASDPGSAAYLIAHSGAGVVESGIPSNNCPDLRWRKDLDHCS